MQNTAFIYYATHSSHKNSPCKESERAGSYFMDKYYPLDERFSMCVHCSLAIPPAFRFAEEKKRRRWTIFAIYTYNNITEKRKLGVSCIFNVHCYIILFFFYATCISSLLPLSHHFPTTMKHSINNLFLYLDVNTCTPSPPPPPNKREYPQRLFDDRQQLLQRKQNSYLCLQFWQWK